MKPLSLKMRAIGLLSQREHSVLELRRKLLRIAADMQRKAASSSCDEPAVVGDDDAPDARHDVDDLLVWLQAQGFLDEARFVESRIHARERRYGSLRIKQELAQHGLSLGADSQSALKETEMARASALWQRKFGGVNEAGAEYGSADALAARARQSRFLTARGFAPEVIRQLLKDRAGAARHDEDE